MSETPASAGVAGTETRLTRSLETHAMHRYAWMLPLLMVLAVFGPALLLSWGA